jgi:hypothetical protein
MIRVQVRFLQFLVSVVGGDRLTVAMLHWDGADLRVAMSFAALPPWVAPYRRDIESTARFMVEKAHKGLGRPLGNGHLDLGLDAIAPVRHGVGDALAWTDVQTSPTRDPVGHFQDMMRALHLEEHEGQARGYNYELRHRLMHLGRELRAGSSDRVRVGEQVEKFLSYTPPLSWKNGVWRHALPLNLHRPGERRMARPAREIVGTVAAAIPDADRAVVLIDLPLEGHLAEVAAVEAHQLQRALEATGRAEVIMAAGADSLLEKVRAKVEREILM